ncbi:MAG: protein kinase domain-containing protein [Steroidobacteraceae bacterium]
MSQVQAVIQPRHVGRYTLIERLGVGGQSEVWRVSDETAEVDLALKILSPTAARSPKAWAALEREYAASALLRHPGILRVLPPERLDGCVVLPMELADGGTLVRLRAKGYLEIVPVLLEVVNALGYAHAQGVVHRDLKPSNVLFDRSGRAKLADFGVAAVLAGSEAAQAVTRAWGGSPFTASPGQLRGEPASPADDVYGLGAMVYELLAGRPPYFPHFDADQIQSGPVPQLVPARQAPVQLIELVMRMLANAVDERPSSMDQIAEELEMTLNATLALDLTELADLSSGALSVLPPPEPIPPAATMRPSFPPPPAPRPEAPADASEPAVLATPESLNAPTEPVLARETVNPFMDLVEVPPLHGLYPPGSGRWYGASGGPRARPRRWRYLVVGVMCAVGAAAVGLRWQPSPKVLSSLRQRVAAAMSSVQGGTSAQHLMPVGVATSAHAASARVNPVASADRSDTPPSDFQARLAVLTAHGVAQWGAADFAAVEHQAGAARRATAAGDAALAAAHWREASVRLAALEHQMPVALSAQLKRGRAALAAGHLASAARAFALARQIDAASPLAAAGERRVQALRAVFPLLNDARRAERAGQYSRAVYDLRQAVAREPGYAPARADLLRVRATFGTLGYQRSLRAGFAALAQGHLYGAQAHFQQALVYRPQGIKAATELSEVNAVLRARAAQPQGGGAHPLR